MLDKQRMYKSLINIDTKLWPPYIRTKSTY